MKTGALIWNVWIFWSSYDEAGHSKGVVRYEELPDPIRLKWDFNAKAEDAIMSSYAVAEKLLNDVDLHILVFSDFGKGLIKDCRLSPDAFIQMALQLAYFRDIGQHHLTYEASMTRLFREGRTETVRSCSVESSNWVKAMVNDAPVSSLDDHLYHYYPWQMNKWWWSVCLARMMRRSLCSRRPVITINNNTVTP